MRAVLLSVVLLALASSPAAAQTPEAPAECPAQADAPCSPVRVTRFQTAFAQPSEVRESCVVQPVYRTTTYPDGSQRQSEDTTTNCTRP